MTKKWKGFHVKEITFRLPEEMRAEFMRLEQNIEACIRFMEPELLQLVEEEYHEQVREQVGLVLYSIMRFRGFDPAAYTITDIYDEEEE